MKRKFFYIVFALILAVFSYGVIASAGQSTRPVITSGTLSANVLLISGAPNVGFVDLASANAPFTAALTAAAINHDYLEITSKTSGQKMYGAVGAMGSNATFGSELIDAWTNYSLDGYETFTTSGTDITSAINTTGNASCYKELAATTGKLLNWKSNITINSGSIFTVRISGTITGGTTYLEFASNIGTSQSYNIYRTGISGVTFFRYASGANLVNFSATGNSLQQQLTPSSSGAMITTTPGGSTYSWSALPGTASTFYNDANGYNWRIISKDYYEKRIATGSQAAANVSITLTDGSAAANITDPALGTAYVGAANAVKYLIVLEDDAKKTVMGYCGEADGTGVKIYSGNNSTQNWNRKDAGFNASANPMRYTIYRYYP